MRAPALVLCLAAATAVSAAGLDGLIVPGAMVEKVSGGYKFTEGTVSDPAGNVVFSDIPNNRLHRWSVADSQVTVLRENSGGGNGNEYAKDGTLYTCEGGGRRVVAMAADGTVTAVAEAFDGKRFNSPNDLWIDPAGGIYVTDPVYGGKGLELDGRYVFHVSADRKQVRKVAEGLKNPNGIVGTPDGKRLFIADHGGKQTFVYDIQADGTLANQKLFAPEGSDGMTLDERGNVYLTGKAVEVYGPDGVKLGTIAVPEGPANVCFGGKDRKTLFISARTSLYRIAMQVTGQ